MDIPQGVRDSALGKSRLWLLWRYETNGEKKPRKVPYYLDGTRRAGAQGSASDRAKLGRLDKVLDAIRHRKFDGIGFALMPDAGVTALDFDNCVDDSGQVHPQVLELVAGTYAELSPSGRGVRAFFLGDLGNRKDPHSEPFGLEVFSSKGFVTVTGNMLPQCELIGAEVVDVPARVQAYVERRFTRAREFEGVTGESVERPAALSDEEIQRALAALPNDLDYDTWVKVGMAVHHETGGEGFELWEEWSGNSPKYSSREYNEERWRSFGKHDGRHVTGGTLVKMAAEHGVYLGPNAPASPEEFDVVTTSRESGGVEGEKKGRFPILAEHEFLGRPRPSWMVKGLIPRAELVVLYGPSGSGKSFLALDMAKAVASGQPWRGRRTVQGRVVYICAEGAGGFRNRLEAYNRAHPDGTGQVEIIAGQPNLLQKDDALELAKSIGKADLIIVDTWAQTTAGGDENSGEDMGKALAHCKGIHRATGAVVLLIHHAGKDLSKGARGWSGLRAAADAELEVIRNGRARCMRVSKQKDGDDGLVFGFDLEVVTIGIDEDDDLITSCVVIEAKDEVPGPKVHRKLGGIEQVVYQAFSDLLADGEPVDKAEMMERAVKAMPEAEDGKRDTRAMRAARALASLCDGEDPVLRVDADGVWVA